MATRLLKKSTSQINIQNVGVINKSVDNKSKLKEDPETSKIQNKWIPKAELKSSNEFTTPVTKESRRQDKEGKKSTRK